MSRRHVQLMGMGTAVPAQSIAQEDAAQYAADLCMAFDRSRSLPALYKRAGVRRRHSVVLDPVSEGEKARQSFYSRAAHNADYGPSTSQRMQKYEAAAPGLAADACQRALTDSNVPAHAITHLVTVSCSGFAAPGFDLQLFPQLGLDPNVSRTHVGFMGCHGAMNGLRVAQAYAASDPNARVLLCATELCSIHHQYTDDAQQLVANALFSDGSAAVVLGQFDSSPMSSRRWSLKAQGSYVIPETTEMMSWRIADHGFRMTLSPQVPEVIIRCLRPWISGWLKQHGCEVEDIQVGRSIPVAHASCGLALKRFRSLRRHCRIPKKPSPILATCPHPPFCLYLNG